MEKFTKFVSKEIAEKNKNTYVLDASGKILGRFASEIAKILRGKHKPDFTPNIDTGDKVVVINADKIAVTGAKEAQKIYYRYSGYIGGQKKTRYKDALKKNIILHAIKGMMPKTKLAKQQIKKLQIFPADIIGLETENFIRVEI